jgi:hypothetical protein
VLSSVLDVRFLDLLAESGQAATHPLETSTFARRTGSFLDSAKGSLNVSMGRETRQEPNVTALRCKRDEKSRFCIFL